MSHFANISCDSGFFKSLNEAYQIEKFRLIPCQIREVNQYTGRSNFVLAFPFEGINGDDALIVLRNNKLAIEEAKLFIAWLSTITREYLDLSYTDIGGGQRFGPLDTTKVTETIDSKRLETVFHVKSEYSDGILVRIDRQEYTNRIRDLQGLTIPDDTVKKTRKLYFLPQREKEKFFDACFSYQFALQNFGRLPSVSIVALVNCVEIMMRDEISSGYCEDARRDCPLKYDVMKKFRKFFEENLHYPLPNNMKKFLNEVYGSRSNYVHIALLGVEKIKGPRYLSFGEDDKVKKQLSEFECIVNYGLITWLEKI